MPAVIKFYRVSEPYGCFSNFSNHRVFIQTTWPTTEHYFQAQKFLDGALKLKILAAKSPMIAARMGRNRSSPLRPDWDQVKDDIMRTAIRAKVVQHADVREVLLATAQRLDLSLFVGDRMLERSPRVGGLAQLIVEGLFNLLEALHLGGVVVAVALHAVGKRLHDLT